MGCHAIRIFESLGLYVSSFLFQVLFSCFVNFLHFLSIRDAEVAQFTLEMSNVENVPSSSSLPHYSKGQNQSPHGGTSLYGSRWNLGLS